MDTLRSNGGRYDPFATDNDEDLIDESRDYSSTEAEDVSETPPPVIGGDERRMQVRAYNFWASQLADRNLPSIADLHPADVEDFGVNSVLLDFTKDEENPRVAFLGENLAVECDVGSHAIDTLSDVPSRSLLSRITDHYMQIISNQAPIGFEAEFVNQRGATILYRGILLPYSSDGTAIDYIYGVINWKELADQAAADELLLEIEQALDPAQARRKRAEPIPLADWADGPGSALNDNVTDAEFDEYADAGVIAPAAADFPEDTPDTLADTPDLVEQMVLADWLARAREQADTARDREDRTRNALYEAIGRAWDFALAAASAPGDFAEILQDSGLTMQERAPLTPIVKLVFGADYDKTRLTEYAAALFHAQRLDLPRGALAEYLRRANGGLKGLVAAERKLRREASGKPPLNARSSPRTAIVRKLRTAVAINFAALPHEGEEFALVMIRRESNGEVAVLGEIPNDVGLVEKAARQLLR